MPVTNPELKNPELLPLFEQAKALLKPYARHLTVRRDEPGYYDLWSEREIVVDGRQRKEMFFAGLIIQKHFLGFYYMPVYTDEQAREFFGPEMLALLKGKSCFHLKKLTPELEAQIADALQRGFALYQERGWI